LLRYLYDSGKLGKTDLQKAAYWYQKSADLGNVNAQFNLGDMYFYGDGVGKNLEQSVLWMRKSAEQGYGKAQNQLGVYYRDGIGVTANPVEAYAWFSAAMNHGFDKATTNLNELEKTMKPDDLTKAKALGQQYSDQYKAKNN